MRILYVTQWFDPEPILKGLAFAKALAARGHQVEVVTGFPNYPAGKLYPGYKLSLHRRDVMDGVIVHRVPIYPSHDNSSLRRILNYLSFTISAGIFSAFHARRFDAIYAYPQVTVGLAAVTAGWLCRRPVVLDIQDMWPDTVLKSGMRGTSWMKPALDFLCRLVYRRSAHIVAQSVGMTKQLAERGVPPEKLAVVYNWADEEAAAPSGRCDLASYHFEGRFNFVFGGNLGRMQGLDTLVRAAHLASQKIPRLQLTIVGNGIEADGLRALVAELRTESVRIAPAVPRQMIGDIFAAADVLVLHLLNEPLFEITIPSKTQFYMAMGKAILIGVNGEAADVVTSAGAGIAVEPENVEAMAQAMVQMATASPETLAEMGRHGRVAYWQKFSFATAIAATEAALQAATSRTGSKVCLDVQSPV